MKLGATLALGSFIARVNSGEIEKGSYLLVDSMDRFRLRTHSQNSTVAARAMADRKTVGHRS